MKVRTAALVAGLLIACSVYAARWQVFEPAAKSKTGLPVTINGRLFRYSPAKSTAPLTIKVTGPTVIRAKVRVVSTSSIRQFKVLAAMDAGNFQEFEQAAMPSAKMEGPNGMRMSMDRSLDFKIPAGEHTITLKPAPTDTTTLYFRVYNRILETGEPSEWESIAPRGFRDLAGVVSREKETTYYRQTAERPLEFKLNGPMRVRILSRAEVPGGKLNRVIKWRLDVKVDGKSIGVYPCEEGISSIASHAEHSESVLTAAATINFDLPDGKHDVEVVLLDSDVKTVNRILIPAKNLTNTGK